MNKRPKKENWRKEEKQKNVRKGNNSTAYSHCRSSQTNPTNLSLWRRLRKRRLETRPSERRFSRPSALSATPSIKELATNKVLHTLFLSFFASDSTSHHIFLNGCCLLYI